MDFTINKFCLSPSDCNSYLLTNGDNAIAIDFGLGAKAMADRQPGLRAVFLTHGHADHIASLGLLAGKSPSTQVFIAQEDAPYLLEPKLNLSRELSLGPLSFEGLNPYLLEDGDEITIPGFRVKCLSTPFHTPGSMCFLIGDCLFTGDSLFHLGVGRSDLPGGDEGSRLSSLRKIASLPGKTRFYPGHGKGGTLEDELSYNPYLRLLN